MTPEESNERLIAIERLARLLDEKDEEIEKLKCENTNLRRQLEYGTGWLQHTVVEDDEKLPVPRLEIVFREVPDHGTHIATYRLVKRHLDGELFGIPLGETRMSSYGSRPPDDAPRRNGCQMAFDAAHLGLPAFLCLPGRATIPIALDEQYPYQVQLGREARRP